MFFLDHWQQGNQHARIALSLLAALLDLQVLERAKARTVQLLSLRVIARTQGSRRRKAHDGNHAAPGINVAAELRVQTGLVPS